MSFTEKKLRILMFSEVFPPARGGIESVGEAAARVLVARGHQVTVITRTPDDGITDRTWPTLLVVIRQPSLWRLWCCAINSDVIFHNHLSLRNASVAFFTRRPACAWIHTWLFSERGPRGLGQRLKAYALRHLHVGAISKAIAEHLPVPSIAMPDPYRDDLFVENTATSRRRALVCVARLVGDKGIDVLLCAMSLLRERGIIVPLTIIGEGPERQRLMAQASATKLEIEWRGSLPIEEVAALLPNFLVQVVPSRWREPFGVVALEGLACGCRLVVTDGGGLGEAVGKCGTIVARDDPAALAYAIEYALCAPSDPFEQQLRHQHLAQFTLDAVGNRLEQWLMKVASAS